MRGAVSLQQIIRSGAKRREKRPARHPSVLHGRMVVAASPLSLSLSGQKPVPVCMHGSSGRAVPAGPVPRYGNQCDRRFASGSTLVNNTDDRFAGEEYLIRRCVLLGGPGRH
jgi:hypothetical protein